MFKYLVTGAIIASSALAVSAQTAPIGSGVLQMPYGYSYGVSSGKIGIFSSYAGSLNSSGSATWPAYVISIQVRTGVYVYSFASTSSAAYAQAQGYISTEKYNLVGEGTTQVPTGFTYGVSCGQVGGHAGVMVSRSSTSSTTYFPEYGCSVNIGTNDYYYFFAADSNSAYAKAVAYFQ